MKTEQVGPGVFRFIHGTAAEDEAVIRKARELVVKHCPDRLPDFDAEVERIYGHSPCALKAPATGCSACHGGYILGQPCGFCAAPPSLPPDLARRVAEALDAGCVCAEGSEGHRRMVKTKADFDAWRTSDAGAVDDDKQLSWAFLIEWNAWWLLLPSGERGFGPFNLTEAKWAGEVHGVPFPAGAGALA